MQNIIHGSQVISTQIVITIQPITAAHLYYLARQCCYLNHIYDLQQMVLFTCLSI